MLKTKGIIPALVGFFLVVSSFYPMYLIVEERLLAHFIENKYSIQEFVDIKNKSGGSELLNSPLEIFGNKIQVLTEDTGIVAPQTVVKRDLRHIFKVRVLVNGEEITPSTVAWIDPNLERDSRFLSWLNILMIKDNDTGEEKVAIIQRLTGDSIKGENINVHKESQKWRIIYLTGYKQIEDEVFSYSERGENLLGVKLVQVSSLSGSFIGYKSDILTNLPSFIFPSLFPQLTFLIGIILLIIGLRTKIRRKEQ